MKNFIFVCMTSLSFYITNAGGGGGQCGDVNFDINGLDEPNAYRIDIFAF